MGLRVNYEEKIYKISGILFLIPILILVSIFLLPYLVSRLCVNLSQSILRPEVYNAFSIRIRSFRLVFI
jgi:uncharacterized membrane protein